MYQTKEYNSLSQGVECAYLAPLGLNIGDLGIHSDRSYALVLMSNSSIPRNELKTTSLQLKILFVFIAQCVSCTYSETFSPEKHLSGGHRLLLSHALAWCSGWEWGHCINISCDCRLRISKFSNCTYRVTHFIGNNLPLT